MRILGWCRRCQKIRTVIVGRPHGFGVQQGVCASCLRTKEQDTENTSEAGGQQSK